MPTHEHDGDGTVPRRGFLRGSLGAGVAMAAPRLARAGRPTLDLEVYVTLEEVVGHGQANGMTFLIERETSGPQQVADIKASKTFLESLLAREKGM